MSLSLRIRDLSLQIILPGTPTQTSYGYSALRSHNVSKGDKKESHHSFFVPAMSHDQLSQPNSTERFFFRRSFYRMGMQHLEVMLLRLISVMKEGEKLFHASVIDLLRYFSYISEIFHSHLSIDSIIRELAVHRQGSDFGKPCRNV